MLWIAPENDVTYEKGFFGTVSSRKNLCTFAPIFTNGHLRWLSRHVWYLKPSWECGMSPPKFPSCQCYQKQDHSRVLFCRANKRHKWWAGLARSCYRCDVKLNAGYCWPARVGGAVVDSIGNVGIVCAISFVSTTSRYHLSTTPWWNRKWKWVFFCTMHVHSHC